MKKPNGNDVLLVGLGMALGFWWMAGSTAFPLWLMLVLTIPFGAVGYILIHFIAYWWKK